jgi:hypothetical protein
LPLLGETRTRSALTLALSSVKYPEHGTRCRREAASRI